MVKRNGSNVLDAPLTFSPYGINGGYCYGRANFKVKKPVTTEGGQARGLSSDQPETGEIS